MASAVLASQNESIWGQSSGGYMAKLPYSNHINPNSNTFPNKQQLQNFNGRQSEDSPVVTQTNSDDAHSFNQRTVESNGHADFNPGVYLCFKISSHTKNELIQLKKRLISELESVRRLNSRIESGKFQREKFLGKKRHASLNPSKDSKRLCQTSVYRAPIAAAEIENLMKMCKQVLTKLMKHKLGWIFNKPVDAAALGLHDYHRIIEQPMDLGTVKSKLVKNLYSSPADFAADVRLTFNNALLYNPQTDEVHKIAQQLLTQFEDLYRPIQAKCKVDSRDDHEEEDELQGSSWNISPPLENTKKVKSKPLPMPAPVPAPKEIEKMEIVPKGSEKIETLPNAETVVQQMPVKPPSGRGSYAKQPKPRAKDPHKRPMSMEEKHRLSIGLQSLPQEKMPQLVHIIKKRNSHMVQEGDEIELDIEAIDRETLWELDRFVTNWKKMVSKSKRQALMVGTSSSAIAATASGEDNVFPVSEKTETAKKVKEWDAGEEDVDIGDEMPMSSFPPVEIEKDEGGGAQDNNAPASPSSSSSGSSSGDSSSSSDSDSGSSSGSDSDADDAQSKHFEAQVVSKHY